MSSSDTGMGWAKRSPQRLQRELRPLIDEWAFGEKRVVLRHQHRLPGRACRTKILAQSLFRRTLTAHLRANHRTRVPMSRPRVPAQRMCQACGLSNSFIEHTSSIFDVC